MKRPAETAAPASLARRLLDGVRDASIYWSFDRGGYLAHRRRFVDGDLDVDLRGRVCLVTGANSGIGLATARALASRGAEVWLLCRNPERGRAAVETIRAEVPGARVELGLLDVASLDAVRAFAAAFPRDRIDVLVHNAGVLPAERTLTGDGMELTFATNVVGPFLLTHLLRPRLEAAGRARVVTVSSGGMYTQRLGAEELDDIDWARRRFDGVRAYAVTKRAEVILNELWAERCPRVAFHAMHPGWADTPAVRSSLPRFYERMKGRLRTPEEGADTAVWLAVCPRLEGESGGFWFDRRPRPTHLVPWTRERPEERARLWSECVRRAGIGAGAGA